MIDLVAILSTPRGLAEVRLDLSGGLQRPQCVTRLPDGDVVCHPLAPAQTTGVARAAAIAVAGYGLLGRGWLDSPNPEA